MHKTVSELMLEIELDSYYPVLSDTTLDSLNRLADTSLKLKLEGKIAVKELFDDGFDETL